MRESWVRRHRVYTATSFESCARVAAVSRRRPARPPSSPKPAGSCRRLAARCPPPAASTLDRTCRRLCCSLGVARQCRLQRHTVYVQLVRQKCDGLNAVAASIPSEGALGWPAPPVSRLQSSDFLLVSLWTSCVSPLRCGASIYHLRRTRPCGGAPVGRIPSATSRASWTTLASEQKAALPRDLARLRLQCRLQCSASPHRMAMLAGM